MPIRLFLTAALLSAACSKSHSQPSLRPPASLFTADDLGPYRTFSLTSDQVKSRMANATEFYANAPDATPGSYDACVNDKVKAQTLRADELNLTADGVLDLKDCGATPGLTINELSYRFRYWLGCPSGGLAGFNGQSLGGAGTGAKACAAKADRFLLVNYLATYDVTGTISVTNDDGSVTDEPYALRQRSLFALQTGTGDPCPVRHLDHAFAWHDSCSLTVATIWDVDQINGATQKATGHEDYLQLAFSRIVEAEDGSPQWFQGGDMNVRLNDWHGTVSYAGSTTPPAFSLTSGAASLTGTVDAAADIH